MLIFKKTPALIHFKYYLKFKMTEKFGCQLKIYNMIHSFSKLF